MKRVILDLDNTIIDYSKSFPQLAAEMGIISPNIRLNKGEIKEIIFKEQNFEKANSAWVELQYRAYGSDLARAYISDQFVDFVKYCNGLELEVWIVSHKSQFSYHCPDFDLRIAAINFLKARGVLEIIPEDNIIFCETHQEKLSTIVEMNPLILVDDLLSVHNQLSPKPCIQVLYSERESLSSGITLNCWGQISQLMNILSTLNYLNENCKLSTIDSKSKNQLAVISCGNLSSILKVFPSTEAGEERAQREHEHMALLLRYGVAVPRPYLMMGNMVVREYLESEEFSVADGVSSIEKILSQTSGIFGSTLPVTDSFSSSTQYQQSLGERIKDLELDYEYLQKISECLNQLSKSPKHQFDSVCVDFCPSDISLKNIIKAKGRYHLIDLENSGMGDPCKLYANLVLHPAHSDHTELFRKILIRHNVYLDDHFKKVYPHVYLEWILILLNPFSKKRSSYSGRALDSDAKALRLAEVHKRLLGFAKALELNDE